MQNDSNSGQSRSTLKTVLTTRGSKDNSNHGMSVVEKAMSTCTHASKECQLSIEERVLQACESNECFELVRAMSAWTLRQVHIVWTLEQAWIAPTQGIKSAHARGEHCERTWSLANGLECLTDGVTRKSIWKMKCEKENENSLENKAWVEKWR